MLLSVYYFSISRHENTIFGLKNVILLLLFVPDYELIDSNTIKGLETQKRISQLMFLNKLKTR